jgi:hypothetical protein
MAGLVQAKLPSRTGYVIVASKSFHAADMTSRQVAE